MFEDRANGPLTEPFPRWRDRPTQNKSTTGSPLGWSFEDVALWLERIRLSQYIPYFRRHRITGPALLTLRRNQLAAIGMSDRNDQEMLLEGSKFLSRQVESMSYSRSAPLPPHLRPGKRFDALRSPVVRNLESKLRRFDRSKRSVVWQKKKPIDIATTDRQKRVPAEKANHKKKFVRFTNSSSHPKKCARGDAIPRITKLTRRKGGGDSGRGDGCDGRVRTQSDGKKRVNVHRRISHERNRAENATRKMLPGSSNRRLRTEMRMKRLFKLFGNAQPRLTAEAKRISTASTGAFFYRRGACMRGGGPFLGG